jgi:hypothetical protein
MTKAHCEEHAEFERRKEEIYRIEESRLKPWNRTAKEILKDHEHELDTPARRLVASLARWNKQPSIRKFERLKAIADRVGVEMLVDGEDP